MWKRTAIQLLTGLAASASALAQEPAVSESRRESVPGVDAEDRVVDRAAVAALLPGLVDGEAGYSFADEGELTADELAAILRDYAGCEVVADALLSGLTRTTADPSPSEPAEEPR